MSELQKMDSVFTETRKHEAVPFDDAFALLGAVIRKTANAADRPAEEIRAPMQRAYLVAEALRSTLASDDEGETVDVPADLLKALREDADGTDADPLPVSEAMARIGKALAPEADPAPKAPVAKSGDVVWGADLADEAAGEGAVNWGPDPQWVDAS